MPPGAAFAAWRARRPAAARLRAQDGLQKNDGTIALSNKGALPPGVDMPGKITYFGHGGSARARWRAIAAAATLPRMA